MKSLKLTKLAFVIAALAGSIATASASVVWDLNPTNANANVGSSSHTFTSSGYQITATGWDNVSGPDTLHQLYYKNLGTSEHGLGLVGTANNELQINSNGTPANYIQLDLTSILAQGFINGKIEVGSVQSGESFLLFGSNSAGTLGTQLGGTFGASNDSTFISVPSFGTYKFISVAAASGDVLPVAFKADIAPVPEVNALLPIIGLGVAFAGFQFVSRRRKVSA
ncbi:MAG: hypothetical protein M3R59_09650 [Verrucomicrobiota bacterium]|nr:hypothetical protein [Verrucomicrobiota bacterium]